MDILVAPLNWGLGHATRCVQIIDCFISQGHNVVLGGDGESLLWLKKRYPSLQCINLAKLEMRYSKRNSQSIALILSLPKLVLFTIKDHFLLSSVLKNKKFDLVISDNRFGLFNSSAHSIYITHQLYLKLPKSLHLFAPIVNLVNKSIFNSFDEVWIPDFEGIYSGNKIINTLTGKLSHRKGVNNPKIKYIGVLSRFTPEHLSKKLRLSNKLFPTLYFDIVAILSGVEPQRSLFENKITETYENSPHNVLVVQGIIDCNFYVTKQQNIIYVPYLDDDVLAMVLQNAKKIISRIGYSSLMDFERLGVLNKVLFSAIPGQSEQEYLLEYFNLSHHKCNATPME